MQYEELVSSLSYSDLFALFNYLDAEPQILTVSGHKSLKILGLCHGTAGTVGHSALFDCETMIVFCFFEQEGVHLHTFIKKTLDLSTSEEAKNLVIRWAQKTPLELNASRSISFDYEPREKWRPEHIEPLEPVEENILKDLYKKVDTSLETLEKTRWTKEDKIDPKLLAAYRVGVLDQYTIILPHMNINGEIVGAYSRSFLPLRQEMKSKYPDIPSQELAQFPKGKYIPYYFKEHDIILSFKNSHNLYGLDMAKDHIARTGKVIVFEGAKSVMLANQYGYKFCVATHTFGIHPNHVSMLLECGAKEIILAFDRQYQTTNGDEWEMYQHKADSIIQTVDGCIRISRILDYNDQLNYKDSPTDQGVKVFDNLFANYEILAKAKKIPILRRTVKEETVIDLNIVRYL